jgi:hypothetical protein
MEPFDWLKKTDLLDFAPKQTISSSTSFNNKINFQQALKYLLHGRLTKYPMTLILGRTYGC